MEIYLIDGTYELFRHFFAVPSYTDDKGREIGAVRGVLNSLRSLKAQGVTHLGVATDHVIESFRNDLYPGYKTSAGVPPRLLSQFPILEDELRRIGVVVWAMVEFEADDALASAAVKAEKDPRVDRVVICTPDKDLGQCVSGSRIVQLDRRRQRTLDEAGIIEKFGVKPHSIPDFLALVGDAADGFPGVPGWGKKTAATVLAKYEHLEAIPEDWKQWALPLRKAGTLSATLRGCWQDALLFRTLATLRTDLPVLDSVDDLLWNDSGREAKSLTGPPGAG
jgi:5'-3' exonuclease